MGQQSSSERGQTSSSTSTSRKSKHSRNQNRIPPGSVTSTFGTIETSTSNRASYGRPGEDLLASGGTVASDITEETEEETEYFPFASNISLPETQRPASERKNSKADSDSGINYRSMRSSSSPRNFMDPSNYGDVRSFESERETRLHHMLKFVHKTNYLPPISNPTALLDSGCGIGIWNLEMAQQFIHCTSIGVDISPPTEVAIPNLTNVMYVAGDLNQPLNFEDNKFDLIHQRDMSCYVGRNSWGHLIGEFMRTLKPGGWAQFCERDLIFLCDHPAVATMNKLFEVGLNYIDVDIFTGRSIKGIVTQTGFVNINEQVIEIPIGDWNPDPDWAHIGFLHRSYIKMLLKTLKPTLTRANHLDGAYYDRICLEALTACERQKGYVSYIFVTAQKPVPEQ